MKALLGIIVIFLISPLAAETWTSAETLIQPSVKALVQRWETEGWERIGTYKNMSSYKRAKETGELKSLGGEGVVGLPIDRVLFLLFDVNRAPDWVFRVKRASILEQSNDLKQSIQYMALDMPFPFTDRDFVVKYQVLPQSATGAVSILVDSIDHAAAPATVGIRAKLHGRYDFIPLSKDQVYCRLEFSADPGGLLPNWVIGMLQQRWPLVTLAMMREAGKEKPLPPLPQYQTWIEAKAG